MRHRSTTRGFTIIETLIFLVVSSFVFVAAIAQYSSQQHKVEFNQGVRGFQSQLLSMISEVDGSFTPDISNYQCTADNTNSALTFVASPLPNENSDCVFLGKAIAFGGDGAGNFCTTDTIGQCSHYTIMPIAGRRDYFATPGTGPGLPVKSLSEAKPFTLASCITDAATPAIYAVTFPCGTAPVSLGPLRPDFSITEKFAQNVSISKAFVRKDDGSVDRTIGGFAFLFNLEGSDALSSNNKSSIDLISLDRITAPLPFQNNTRSRSIAAIDGLIGATPAQINPPHGISLCVLNDYGMKSIITIGASQSRLDVQVLPSSSSEMAQCP